jgi:taurine dioxygenase
MLTIEPTGAVLGASVQGVDLSQPLSTPDFGRILKALGEHGVLRFPGQKLAVPDVQRISMMFGDIQGASSADPSKVTDPYANVGILSNVKKDGAYIGSPDAGQDWHTDMSYRHVRGFVNVLYGIQIPRRDGKALGGTEFSNMAAAYDALPADVKQRLDGMTATHDFEKFWEHMRRDRNSGRPPMTPEQRKRRPPVVHKVILTHPVSGRKILYCNPGYAIRINELDPAESDAMLDFLFRHQLEMRFRYTHEWNENDLLIWDNLSTIHRAIDDYRPDEFRLMRRCQVLATKVFDQDFLRPLLQAA